MNDPEVYTCVLTNDMSVYPEIPQGIAENREGVFVKIREPVGRADSRSNAMSWGTRGFVSWGI